MEYIYLYKVEDKVTQYKTIYFQEFKKRDFRYSIKFNYKLPNKFLNEFTEYLSNAEKEEKDKLETKLIEDEEILKYLKENDDLYKISPIFMSKNAYDKLIDKSTPSYYKQFG